MPNNVCNGAGMTCSFGTTQAKLIVLPIKRILMENNPAASIMDYVPMVNIPTFGQCSSLINPTVASATAAALGVLTPMPCIPATTSPWVPGKNDVLLTNQPALMDYCINTCMYMGIITLSDAGQTSIGMGGAGGDMSAMINEMKAAADEACKKAAKEIEEALKEAED